MLFRKELDNVLVGPGPRRTDGQSRNPNLAGLRQRLDREGTRHLEGQMASVATQIRPSIRPNHRVTNGEDESGPK